jgi:hypothetical protein
MRLQKIRITTFHNTSRTEEYAHSSNELRPWGEKRKNYLAVGQKFSGEFEKSRKAAISFVMSVCPSVRMEQLGSQ